MVVSLVDEMSCIVNSLTNKYLSELLNELYIKRIDPYHDICILFTGDNSLTKDEDKYHSQVPLLNIRANDKSIYLYTGVECYLKNEYLDEECSPLTKLSVRNNT